MKTKIFKKGPASLPASLLAVVKEREEIVAWMESAKEQEGGLREQIVKAFPVTVGTNNFEGENYVATIQQGETVKIDEGALDAVMEELAATDDALGVVGVLIEYRPHLVKKRYDDLTEEQKRIFDQCVTRELGKPSLKISLKVDATAPAPKSAKPAKSKPAKYPGGDKAAKKVIQKQTVKKSAKKAPAKKPVVKKAVAKPAKKTPVKKTAPKRKK